MNTEFQIKRPSFIIFTDKDGTLNLEDKNLDNIFKLILSMNGIVIPITGRTVGDILESLKSHKLKIPEILVGDNGANIYSTSQGKFLIKKSLDIQKVKDILSKFISIGGLEDNVRLTDGNMIYAIENPNVKKYYKKNKTVQYYKNTNDILDDISEVTKVTLAGNNEQMQIMADYAEGIDFWSDLGATAFPSKAQKNYRLDIAYRNINKGEAVRLIASTLKPPYGYMCIGNGENDISMFKQAINDKMIAGIMEDSPEELKKEMHDYSKLKNKR